VPHHDRTSRRSPDQHGGGPTRRGFLARAGAVLAGGLALLVPMGVGVWAFLDPLRRRSAAAMFLPVTDLSAVPDDGVPRQFVVVADRTDAWTGFQAEPIGACYLARQPGKAEVRALSATCPHAGCFIEIDPASRCFRCPCHDSSFTLEGAIVAPSPSPRAMDELECRVAAGGAVEVQWRNFYTGIAAKVPRP